MVPHDSKSDLPLVREIVATLLRFVVVVVTVDDHAMLQHLTRQ